MAVKDLSATRPKLLIDTGLVVIDGMGSSVQSNHQYSLSTECSFIGKNSDLFCGSELYIQDLRSPVVRPENLFCSTPAILLECLTPETNEKNSQCLTYSYMVLLSQIICEII